MKTQFLALAIFSFILFSGCKNDKNDDAVDDDAMTTEQDMEVDEEDDAPLMETKKVTVALESKSNSNVTGNAVLTQENGEVRMVVVVSGLQPGTHAIHLHETADCSAADATSSGGHWNPTGAKHGKWGDAGGYHKGDIGNFEATNNGNGSITFSTPEWCIGCGDNTKDVMNKAIVIHKGTDDFTSQPSGNAGDRISCGGIIQ